MDDELQRIARMFGATEMDIREADRRAYEEPMVPLDEIMAHIVAFSPCAWMTRREDVDRWTQEKS